MTNTQLYLVIFAPVILNGLITVAIFGVFMSEIHEHFTDFLLILRAVFFESKLFARTNAETSPSADPKTKESL